MRLIEGMIGAIDCQNYKFTEERGFGIVCEMKIVGSLSLYFRPKQALVLVVARRN